MVALRGIVERLSSTARRPKTTVLFLLSKLKLAAAIDKRLSVTGNGSRPGIHCSFLQINQPERVSLDYSQPDA